MTAAWRPGASQVPFLLNFSFSFLHTTVSYVSSFLEKSFHIAAWRRGTFHVSSFLQKTFLNYCFLISLLFSWETFSQCWLAARCFSSILFSWETFFTLLFLSFDSFLEIRRGATQVSSFLRTLVFTLLNPQATCCLAAMCFSSLLFSKETFFTLLLLRLLFSW